MRNIFSNLSLIEWLQRQPAEKTYYYGSCRNCLLAQYFTAMGVADVRVGHLTVEFSDGKGRNLPKGWDAVAQGQYWDLNQTFGGALQRANELLR